MPFATLLGPADGATPGATSKTATDAEAEWAALGAWLDQRLLALLAIYLATETEPAYQPMAVDVDPVCGMRFSTTSAAARREFRGHAYILCSDACEARFTSDPAYYVQRRRETLEA